MSRIRALVSKELSDLRRNPGVFYPAVLTGLEPDREERWPDVLSFVAALASAPGVTEPSVLQRPHPPARRRRGAGLPATLLIALCLAVALATFGASYAVVELLQ